MLLIIHVLISALHYNYAESKMFKNIIMLSKMCIFVKPTLCLKSEGGELLYIYISAGPIAHVGTQRHVSYLPFSLNTQILVL